MGLTSPGAPRSGITSSAAVQQDQCRLLSQAGAVGHEGGTLDIDKEAHAGLLSQPAPSTMRTSACAGGDSDARSRIASSSWRSVRMPSMVCSTSPNARA